MNKTKTLLTTPADIQHHHLHKTMFCLLYKSKQRRYLSLRSSIFHPAQRKGNCLSFCIQLNSLQLSVMVFPFLPSYLFPCARGQCLGSRKQSNRMRWQHATAVLLFSSTHGAAATLQRPVTNVVVWIWTVSFQFLLGEFLGF